MYGKIKRTMDFMMALLGMIFLSPVFLILIIAIKLDSRGPVFFRQKRVGIHKTHFNILKFRTMRIDTPQDLPTRSSISQRWAGFCAGPAWTSCPRFSIS